MLIIIQLVCLKKEQTTVARFFACLNSSSGEYTRQYQAVNGSGVNLPETLIKRMFPEIPRTKLRNLRQRAYAEATVEKTGLLSSRTESVR